MFGLGQAPAPAFGSSFGQASPLGGGPSPFGSNTPTMAPSAGTGAGAGGFAQFAGSQPSFGSAAASGGGFGSLSQPSASNFGGFGARSFGSPTPFGAPRR